MGSTFEITNTETRCCKYFNIDSKQELRRVGETSNTTSLLYWKNRFLLIAVKGKITSRRGLLQTLNIKEILFGSWYASSTDCQFVQKYFLLHFSIERTFWRQIYEFHAMMTFLYGTNIPKLSSLLKKEIFNDFFFKKLWKISHQSKNFFPPREPSQSPRAFGSWRPTNISSESIDATGPQ